MSETVKSASEHGAVALIVFLGILHALGAWSNDLFAPSLPLAADALGVGYGHIQLNMTALLLGFAAGQMLYGPLSDRFGRRSTLVAGLAIYTFASVLCASAGSLEELVAARTLQGLGGATGMVLVRAIILDRWVGEEASKVLSSVTMIAFLSPAVIPLIGGFLASLGHWPLVFWTHTGLGMCLLLGALTLLSGARGARPDVSVASRFRAYADVLKDRRALLLMGCVGIGHGGLLAFVTNSAFVFVTYLGLQPLEYGICFSAVMMGGVAGSLLNRRLVTDLGIPRMMAVGAVTMALSGVAAVILNLFFGGIWSSLVPSICYMFGMAFILTNAVAQVLTRFREIAGAAAALVGVNQLLLGAIAAAVLSLNEAPSAMPLAAALAVAGIGSATMGWAWLGSVAAGADAGQKEKKT
ncbi:MAG: multidrug effflux MFS transporter [Rhodospirillaceae bacterium]|nr:multidrug effflux MFS transporter [Rhodospirillaceae bacterium]MDE0000030.1 multidrug effflux MFS transporter [Rhodospirillaceae bacterium]